MLWVEQPVGTGFSQGTPTAQNEEDVAAQLVGFFQQFLEVFSELKGKKFYVTGESVSFPNLSSEFTCLKHNVIVNAVCGSIYTL